MKSRVKKYFYLLIFVITALIGLIVANAALSLYRVTKSTTMEITEWNICKKITNNAAKDIFIPAKTSTEWTRFFNSPPSEIAVSACCDPNVITSCGSWGSCSVSCGGGAQTRTCTNQCGASVQQSQSCNTQACEQCGSCPLEFKNFGGPDAMDVGQSITGDLGSRREVSKLFVSVGCNDGERGNYRVTFDDSSNVNFDAGCNSEIAVGPKVTRYLTLRMNSGGGDDGHISFSCCGSRGWGAYSKSCSTPCGGEEICGNGVDDNGNDQINENCPTVFVSGDKPDAIDVGWQNTINFGTQRYVTSIYISPGCNDGEGGRFHIIFEDGTTYDSESILGDDVRCGTNINLENSGLARVSSLVTIRFVAGGGDDRRISWGCCGSDGWGVRWK